jgi:hypothetical protein
MLFKGNAKVTNLVWSLKFKSEVLRDVRYPELQLRSAVSVHDLESIADPHG